MTWTVEAALARYAEVARPILLACTLPQVKGAACIMSTRVACEVFRKCGLRARPFATTFVVHSKAHECAFVVGLRGEAKARAQATAKTFAQRLCGDGPGWDGHLVAVVQNRYLVDSTFDQATMPEFGFHVEPTVLTVDYGDRPVRTSVMEAGLHSDASGEDMVVSYAPLADNTWRDTEAWRDKDAPGIADVIYLAMLRKECVQ